MYLFQFPNVLSLSAKVRNLRREWTSCELQSILFLSLFWPQAVSRISESQSQPFSSQGACCAPVGLLIINCAYRMQGGQNGYLNLPCNFHMSQKVSNKWHTHFPFFPKTTGGWNPQTQRKGKPYGQKMDFCPKVDFFSCNELFHTLCK